MMRLAGSILALLLTTNLAFADRLDDIARSGTIRIAHRTDATPFSFVDEGKKVTGFTVDLCSRVVDLMQRRLKLNALKIEWVPVTTETRFEAIANGKADLECGSSTATLGRMELVDFSNFVFLETTGLLVKKDAGISTGDHLAGKTIAVISGTTNEKAVTTANEQTQLKAVIIPVKDRAEGISLLESGRADAFASDKLLLLGAQIKNAQALTILPDDLSIEPYAIMLPRGEWQLRLAVNGALANIYRSGQIIEIFNKWFSPIGLRPGALLSAIYILGAVSE
jgi:glutamate/aspartate transport system substrate-binding protein